MKIYSSKKPSKDKNKKIKVYSPKKPSKRKKAIKNLEKYVNDDGSRKESKIEKKVREWLDAMGYYYIQEKPLQYKGRWKKFDFWVTDGINYSFLIECDGDYWHDPNGKTKLQKKNQKNDKFKDELCKEFGIPLLRFSEKQIKFHFNEVEELIINEIDRQKNYITTERD